MECRKTKTKTKVITLAIHKGHRQYSKPIRQNSKWLQLLENECAQVTIGFACLGLDENVARDFWAKLCGVASVNQLLFDTQMKITLECSGI